MAVKNYPPGVFVTSLLFTFLMGSTSIIQGLLVLCLTIHFKVNDAAAYSLYAAYSSSIYATSLIGGYIGQHYLKSHIAIAWGLVLTIVGLAAISYLEKNTLLFGLSCFAFGSGLIYPNAYHLLGKLYPAGAIGRSSGFTMAYTGMNLGSLIGFGGSGYIARYFSYQSAFYFATLLALFAFILFMGNYKKFLLKIYERQEKTNTLYGILVIVIGIPLLYFLLHFDAWFRFLVITGGVIISMSLITYAFYKRNDDPPFFKGLMLFYMLAIFAIVFWAIYSLQPTAVITFLDRNVYHSVLDAIPAASIMAFNPIFMLLLGPALGFFWLHREKAGKPVSDLTKFIVALAVLSLSLLVLVAGIYNANPSGYTSLVWIGLFFLFLSTAEMIIAPAGYGAVGKLLPERFHGVMLGIWQLMVGVAVAISGGIAKLTTHQHLDLATQTPQSTNPIYLKFFAILSVVALFFAFLAYLCRNSYKRLSNLS